jgi:hypothetical protein
MDVELLPCLCQLCGKPGHLSCCSMFYALQSSLNAFTDNLKDQLVAMSIDSPSYSTCKILGYFERKGFASAGD